ncbi:eIF-2-alpha kinase activator GCN1 [Octopus sinensis]|uniref:EIF-2-alpha kinase activator GCN1 n=1 Tax=Octopus sinensis TaxID=2607531 RepID=A0A6P7TUX9_9MOLL|nr:eIF-2-alpha kinase activator GCN1 [Octopus sinensis]
MAERTSPETQVLTDADILKKFAQKVTTSNRNERIELLKLVKKSAANALPENAVKGILRYLLLTLGRYQDRRSQLAVQDVVSQLALKHPQATLKCISTSLANFANLQKTCGASSKAVSTESLQALIWTCIVADQVFAPDKSSSTDDLKALVSLQSLLLYGCHSARLNTLNAVAYKHISRLWKKSPATVQLYTEYLTSLEGAPHLLSLASLVMQHLHDTKNKECIQACKKPFCDLYLKQVLAYRSTPPLHLLENCQSLLRHVNHEDFNEILLPAAQKATLRNPEIILQAVEHLLIGVQLDMSKYALDLAKPIAKQLFVKEESVRQSASNVLEALARQCSSPDAVDSVTIHLFQVLAGSEGKLISADQRIGVLNGINSLSHHVVSGVAVVQKLTASITERFIPILGQEVHEGTLVCILQVLTSWCSRLHTEVPPALVDGFKKGLTLKTSTSAVRNAYICCMVSAFHGDTLLQAQKVVPLLLQVVEKASNQPNQTQLVTEALSASRLLLQLSLADIQYETKLAQFWNVVLDASKLLFFNDKSLSSLSDEAFLDLIFMVEKLILDFPTMDLNKISKPLYKALVLGLTHSSWLVRKQSMQCLKRVFHLSDRLSMVVAIIAELDNVLTSMKIPTTPSLSEDSEEQDTKKIDAKVFGNALLALCKIPDPKPSEIETLALAAFISAHHPIIVSYSKHMWQDILKQSGQNAKTFVKDHSDKCLEIVSNADFETCVENGVASLVSTAPDRFLPQLIAQICDQLASAEFLQVTQDEYGIFRCPEGQLYDKAVLESVLKNEVKETNIRRENKLYSYAEQMAEIELRKELEKKKRAKGGDVKLSKQQEEKLQMALKKEAQIRSNIRMLNNKLVRCCNTLHSAIKGDCNAVCMFMSNLCQVLIPLLYSPLAAAPVCRLLITLGNSAFMDKQFGEMVSHATVRALKPYCQLESQWTQEDEVQQIERMVQLLHDRVQARVGGGPKHPFPASTFAYFFHLLSVALSGQHCPVNDASTTCLRALQLIVCHARIRLKTHGGVGGGDDNNNKNSAKSKNSKKRRKKRKNNENEKNEGGGGGGQKKQGEIGDIHQDEQVEKIREKVMMMGMVRMEEDMDEQEEEEKGGGGGDCRLSHEDEEILRKLYDPQLLPHKPLLQLLIKLIGTVTSTKIQDLSNTALIEVAHSLSGNIDCAFPSNEDISVMLLALEAPSLSVKRAVLEAMTLLTSVLPNKDDDLEMWLKVVKKIWIAKFDQETEVQELAKMLETKLKIQNPPPKMVTTLIEDVIHPEESVRQAAASTVAAVLQLHKKQVAPMMHQLLDKYGEKLFLPPPEVDSFGRVIGEPVPDDWMSRSGIALCLTKMAPLLPKHLIAPLFAFYVPKALGDRAPEVQTNMRDAALAAVNEHGKDNVNTLLPVFENFLSTAANTASNDAVRQSIVILMGSLAKHLDKSDPKVKPIVARLISALSTPSQEVQIAVSYCLPPLVPAIGADATTIVQQLLRLLLESENYGERKGAAYGLAGLVKGLGIVALKKMGIINTLTEAIKDKKNPRRREGSLFAFEMLCTMLGKLFEPYVVVILPHLLLCFGDHNMYVRQAADDTAKAIMTNLSGHGVKFVLPSLLKGLEEDAWRTKAGSVELLGAMAFCAPKQLSACLPNIVPKLIEVLTDSHNKVQRAGAQALQQIGSVIRNPEIQAIVPVLLAALQDPTQKTYASLQALLDTKFVHFIDAASLALIMPVVERAFQDRTTDTRKMAAQIIGNMYSLTDQKDLSPYLPTVIPGLKQSLLDPVPEVRNVSSRALGTMVRGMGEGTFDDLLPWLMETLVSERSSVDRSGAAQGLSEVIGGMGLAKLQILMPDIVQTADRNDIAPHIRDGYIMMYIYLPLVFKDDFLPYIGHIIPSILKALADESEFVRDTALRAGQRIINMYAETAIELLLPELENGLFDENWRIRYSSVQLLGDLLYKVSGVSGKMSTETANEDDNFGTETSQKAVLRVFGKGRRNRVLAGLYMGRSDTALLVRQSALHVWKIIVSNTPRTLREILPVLFSLLLGCLASTSYDKRQVAARTLGDLVRKLGERVLPEIIPILEKGLDSDRSDERQGVCIGLSEIMASTSRDHVTVFANNLIPSVRRALCDPLPEVREAAARTFDNLHHNIGARALDEILPTLLQKLSEPGSSSEWALDGLKQVMTVKSRVVLPYLVPQLIKPPVDTRALAFLSSVAGDVLSRHLGKILPALLSSLSSAVGTPREEEELDYCESVVLSVTDDIGINTILTELLSAANNPNSSAETCCAAVSILKVFCGKTKADYSACCSQLLRTLIALFTHSDERVLLASWKCLDAIAKDLKNMDTGETIQQIRQAIRFATSDYKGTGKELPGFCLSGKSISPLLPIFREGILHGSPELKEMSAEGLGEIIQLTSAPALSPSVINITGPLIRILGDRYPCNVKVAVLETLNLLLNKVGAIMKPFLPQLQTTFTKALNDANRTVRLRAASAMGGLIVIHTRVEPLITELHTNIKTTDDTSIRDTTLQALRNCVGGSKGKISDNLRKTLSGTLLRLLNSPEDTTRLIAAGCLGALTVTLPDSDFTDMMNSHLMDTDNGSDWTLRHGRSVALAVAIKEGADRVLVPSLQPAVFQTVTHFTAADRIPICLSGLRAATYVLSYQITNSLEPSTEILALLAKGLKHDSNDVKQLCGQLASHLARQTDQPLPAVMMKYLVPALVMGTKEKNFIVKGNSEYGLLAVLQLAKGDSVYQATLSLLDVGMQEALQDVHTKTLRKLLAKTTTPVREEIDDSVLV